MAKKSEKVRSKPGEIFLDFGDPNPKQRKLITSTYRYNCYGGARGGGKTWVLIRKAVGLCLQYGESIPGAGDGIKILIMRKTYKELQQTVIDPLRTFINSATKNKRPCGSEIASYNASLRTMYFVNGAKILFGHLQHTSDIDEYQGAEYDVIFMDEATHFTEWEFRVLGACLRGTNNFPKRFYLTCNPGGVGHQWVKRLFIDRKYTEDENPSDYMFIPAKVTDNTALVKASPGYLQMLNNLPEDKRKAWRDGDWNALSGQFFGEVSPLTHVCEPFVIPKEWKRYRCFDYGLDMFACFWIAIGENDRCYVYREYYHSDLTVSEAAEQALSLTPQNEEIEMNIAPPDMWSRSRETGRTQADIFALNGLPIVKASNNRVQGWSAMKEDLKIQSDGKPNLIFFNTCEHILSDLTALQHDEKNPDDVAKEPHDITHGPDGLRYGVITRKLGYEPDTSSYEEEEDTEVDYKSYMCGGQPTYGYMFG